MPVADQKISALTLMSTLPDSTLIPVVDMTGTPTTKKTTMLILRNELRKSLFHAQGLDLTAGVPVTITFAVALGTEVNGKDYELFVNNHLSDELEGYSITLRTQNGFTITSIETCRCELLAVYKSV
jgi:hypothetical protein